MIKKKQLENHLLDHTHLFSYIELSVRMCESIYWLRNWCVIFCFRFFLLQYLKDRHTDTFLSYTFDSNKWEWWNLAKGHFQFASSLCCLYILESRKKSIVRWSVIIFFSIYTPWVFSNDILHSFLSHYHYFHLYLKVSVFFSHDSPSFAVNSSMTFMYEFVVRPIKSSE
jgi:hypothetical protein